MFARANTIKLSRTLPQVSLIKQEAPTDSAVQDIAVFVFTVDTLDLPVKENEEIVLGRFHRSNSIQPDIDLTDLGGTLHGVSRLHVKLSHKANGWWLEDLDSSNGTWIDDERLAPFVPCKLLSNSSWVRLANLKFGLILPEVTSQAPANFKKTNIATTTQDKSKCLQT